MITDFTLVSSKRGVALHYGGSKYFKHHITGSKTTWRCSKRGMKCRAKVVTKNNVIVAFLEDHNHTESSQLETD